MLGESIDTNVHVCESVLNLLFSKFVAYAGGTVATGRASYAGQVEKQMPNRAGPPGCWGGGGCADRLVTSP
jgi:hypothetical protein